MDIENASAEEDVKEDAEEKAEGEVKKRFNIPRPVALGLMEYLLVPVLGGFITAGVLAIAGLERLGLNKFGMTNLPTISMQGDRYTTYSGFLVTVGLGCVVCLILLKLFRNATKWIHLSEAKPSESIDAMPMPSVMGFFKEMIHLTAVPLLIVLSSYLILKLAETGLLSFVLVDKKFRTFEMTLTGVVVVVALCSILVFFLGNVLTFLLKGIRRKDVELEEVK